MRRESLKTMDSNPLVYFELVKAILLESLIENTYLILAVTVTAASTGIPLAESLLVISAGAFAAQGLVEFHVVVFITFACATLGDNIGYLIGKEMSFFEKYMPSIVKKFVKTEGKEIGKHVGLTIFFSRFLFTALGPPINILSGMNKIQHKKFLLFGSVGELIWAFEMATLGYYFGVHVEELFDIINDAVIVLLLILAVGWLVKKSR